MTAVTEAASKAHQRGATQKGGFEGRQPGSKIIYAIGASDTSSTRWPRLRAVKTFVKDVRDAIEMVEQEKTAKVPTQLLDVCSIEVAGTNQKPS